MISYAIGLYAFLVKKVVLYMLFLIIMQEANLIHTFLCPLKKD